MPASDSGAGVRLRVRIDPIRCTAYGFCAEYCPEVFTLDDWGYAWVQRADVPPDLTAVVSEAARRCPTGAIVLEVVNEAERGALAARSKG